jgi:hypothetical protein
MGVDIGQAVLLVPQVDGTPVDPEHLTGAVHDGGQHVVHLLTAGDRIGDPLQAGQVRDAAPAGLKQSGVVDRGGHLGGDGAHEMDITRAVRVEDVALHRDQPDDLLPAQHGHKHQRRAPLVGVADARQRVGGGQVAGGQLDQLRRMAVQDRTHLRGHRLRLPGKPLPRIHQELIGQRVVLGIMERHEEDVRRHQLPDVVVHRLE